MIFIEIYKKNNNFDLILLNPFSTTKQRLSIAILNLKNWIMILNSDLTISKKLNTYQFFWGICKPDSFIRISCSLLFFLENGSDIQNGQRENLFLSTGVRDNSSSQSATCIRLCRNAGSLVLPGVVCPLWIQRLRPQASLDFVEKYLIRT